MSNPTGMPLWMRRYTQRLGRGLECIGLPTALAYRTAKLARCARMPWEVLRRRRIGRSIAGAGAGPLQIDRDAGYVRLQPESLPQIAPAMAACRDIYAEHTKEHVGAQTAPYAKPFLVNILDVDGLERHRALLELALSREIVTAACAYFGTLPLLRAIAVYVSPANTSLEASQLFHCDYDDFRQLKCFLNVLPVSEDEGPFTFLSTRDSQRVRRALGHGWRDGRISDEDVFKHCDAAGALRLEGPSGSGGLVDTSNCLHFGSRARRGTRVVLMMQYTTHPNIAIDLSARSGIEGRPIFSVPERLVANDKTGALIACPH